jgi:hypothetical protein
MDLSTVEKMSHVINFYSRVKKRNMYHPSINNKKTLTIIACHVNSELKLKTIFENAKFLNFASNDIIIINSRGLPYNQEVQNFCSSQNIKYIEVDNGPALDFGKWCYILKTEDLSEYSFVVLTNDSYVIHRPIHHFYNLTAKMNAELYGYNDSTQINYHYQSYLFSLRRDAVDKFINMFDSKIHLINGYTSVINNFELKLTQHFEHHDCFLKIGSEPYNRNKNIFFDNDVFYGLLMKNKLFPFTKIRRVS